MPHIRAAAPDVLVTARAQRWEPVNVLLALSPRRSPVTRRAQAPFLERENVPLLETRPDASSIPTPTQQALRTLE